MLITDALTPTLVESRWFPHAIRYHARCGLGATKLGWCPGPSASVGAPFCLRRLNFTERVAAASVRPVRVPWRSRILRPCQAPRNCNPDQICTTAQFSYRKPRQGQPQPSLDFQQRARSKHRMPRVKVPTEDNGPCDFLRGQTREHSTIAVDLLFLHRLRSASFHSLCARRPF